MSNLIVEKENTENEKGKYQKQLRKEKIQKRRNIKVKKRL